MPEVTHQLTPEQRARQKIDALLVAAGWILQNKDGFNRNAGPGVAVREFSLPNGPCDYLLFVGGKAAGVIEAKKAGTTLSTVAEQSDRYMAKLPEHLARWADTLIFDYESNGEEVFFKDMRDPKPRSRRVFAFHRPETLLEWAKAPESMRARFTAMPALDATGLRDCQIEAVEGLERSLARGDQRGLIQMATGAGKTFTACTFSYRLIKHAGARRILFLVDRNNLGDQTLREYQQYHPPGTANRFASTYNVQHLHGSRIDRDAKVVITTIQRLYSMLKGEELAEELEETSAFETWAADEGEIPPVGYNPDIPIETFDIIVTDECHRSIYGLWRQVLEYFDAHIIGLTATPSKHTLGFFNRNLVAEYPYERSVVDGVNVGYEVFRIRTQITEAGGRVSSEYAVQVRDKRTRRVRYKELDEDLEYQAQELDRSVTVPNQIRTVIQCFKDNLFTELFPERSGEWVPKTLVFAKDDNHAEEIVHITREVFGEGNEFCKKITYRNTSEDPKALIKGFRVDPMPRIAVTVDMIATGTDIKPVEVLLFMRDVKSAGYFEQMKGRGVRSIDEADLRQVTPDAHTKTRFILVDAVGVTETIKTVSQPLERKRTLSFQALLEQIAAGRRDDDALSSLAGRLALLEGKLDEEDRARVAQATGGADLHGLASGLLTAIDPDEVEKAAIAATGVPADALTEAQLATAAEQLKDAACAPFDDPKVRQLLLDLKQKTDIVIDAISTDEVTGAGYDLKQSETCITSFKEFMEAHKDELTALQILYSQPYGKRHLTYDAVKELTHRLADPPQRLTTATVWQAYKRLQAGKVRGAPADQLLTDIISLVRFALGYDDMLEPFSAKVEQRFNLWVGRQKKAGREFTDEQMDWLRLIRDHLAANVEIVPRDLMQFSSFSDRGGLIAARRLFGQDLDTLLTDLNEALVA
ncbi:MAG: type I restriction-modification enzyme R subunit C-terminal domain-containing protein [Desulfovibrionaceae bacterium]